MHRRGLDCRVWTYLIASDNRWLIHYKECTECGYQSVLKLMVKHMPYHCTSCGNEWVKRKIPHKCLHCGVMGSALVHYPRFPHGTATMDVKEVDRPQRLYG